jgi:excisionase family DNA binding protein
LTLEQVSSYLQVSRSVVYGEISAGNLPAVRLGLSMIRISKWALQPWLERSTGTLEFQEDSSRPSWSSARMH